MFFFFPGSVRHQMEEQKYLPWKGFIRSAGVHVAIDGRDFHTMSFLTNWITAGLTVFTEYPSIKAAPIAFIFSVMK